MASDHKRRPFSGPVNYLARTPTSSRHCVSKPKACAGGGLRSPQVQGIIRAAKFAINAIVTNPAINMNWATATYCAELLLLLVLLVNGSKRRQKFFPIRVALFHSINFPLMFFAKRMPRPIAKTLGTVSGSEIEPAARHVCFLWQQPSANSVLRGDLAL
jgi:hypothetical protein